MSKHELPTLDQVYKQYHGAANAVNNLVELLYNSNQNLLRENQQLKSENAQLRGQQQLKDKEPAVKEK